MNFLKKSNKDEIIYKAGLADAERKLIPIWKQKLADLENEKDEIIEAKDFEIARLGIQIKNWKADYDKAMDRETAIRKRESLVKRDENRIKRFKEELREELTIVMSKNQEKFQSVLKLIGENSNEIEN